MPNAIPFIPRTIGGGFFTDWQAPVGGDIGKAWVWDGSKFAPAAFEASGAVATHAALTSGVHGISSFAATFLDDTSQSAVRTTLGLVIGTDVQAYDAELAAIAGLVSAADRLPYFTGSGAASLATFTTFGRSLVDDADAATARTTLGLGSIATDAQSTYLAATGATPGATSQVQAFTNGLKFPSAQPASDSTTAFRVFKADGSTAVGTWDTTNGRFGVNVTPTSDLQVASSSAGNVAVLIRPESGASKNSTITMGRTTSGGAASNVAVLTADSTGLQINTNNGNGPSIFLIPTTNTGFVGVGTTSPAARLHVTAAVSSAAWGTAGTAFQVAAMTHTDTSTATSGTAATAVFNSFAQPTLAATNASVTTTRAATVYIANAPTNGTNQTITNAYAFWIDNGAARFDGNLGFFATEPVAQQTSGANLTNNVTSGGTTDQIDDFAGAVYATDAATIRNDIYQLARKLKQINDGLRAYGLFT